MTSSRVFGSADADERSRLLLELPDNDDDAATARTADEEVLVDATFATTPRATRVTARDVTIMMMVLGSEVRSDYDGGWEIWSVFDICEAIKVESYLRTKK
jgi:hypothetical protein